MYSKCCFSTKLCYKVVANMFFLSSFSLLDSIPSIYCNIFHKVFVQLRLLTARNYKFHFNVYCGKVLNSSLLALRYLFSNRFLQPASAFNNSCNCSTRLTIYSPIQVTWSDFNIIAETNSEYTSFFFECEVDHPMKRISSALISAISFQYKTRFVTFEAAFSCLS